MNMMLPDSLGIISLFFDYIEGWIEMVHGPIPALGLYVGWLVEVFLVHNEGMFITTEV